MMSSAAVTLSKFASGSPMPIITTLDTSLSPFGSLPMARLAHHNWPMISALVRFRLNPCLPVEQNEQSSAHPTWLEMHSVPVSYTHLRAHETVLDLVCRLLLEKK